MARLLDLPPEVRLEIYSLLLLNPIQQGQRSVFGLHLVGSNQIISGRGLCAYADPSHEAHSARPCCADISSTTLHHLNFTDLMSLAGTNRMLYAEASKTIYNHADLTMSYIPLPPIMEPTAIPALLSRYTERHCPTTLAMLHSLTIDDRFAALSTRDTRLIVDLVNTHLPNLRVLDYYVRFSTATSSSDFLRRICRLFLGVQPFACLRAGVCTTLKTDDLPDDLPLHDQLTLPFLRDLRERLVNRVISDITRTANDRRLIRDDHTRALDRGRYLQATLTLRSMSESDAQPNHALNSVENMLLKTDSLMKFSWKRRKFLQGTRAFNRECGKT